jgi:hypothetical protein
MSRNARRLRNCGLRVSAALRTLATWRIGSSSGGVSRMATGGTLLRDRGHTRMLVVMHNTSIPGNSKRDRLGKANK